MAALLDDAPADALVGEAEDGDDADDDLAGGARLECPAPGCGRSFKCVANLAAHRRSHGAAVLALAGFNGLPAPLPAGDGKFHCSIDGCPYGPGGKTLANKKSARQHWAQARLHGSLARSHTWRAYMARSLALGAAARGEALLLLAPRLRRQLRQGAPAEPAHAEHAR